MYEMLVNMRIVSILVIITFFGLNGFAQKTSKNNFSGSWQTAGGTGPWSNGVVPNITTIGDAPNNMNWFIDGYVTSRSAGSPAAHTFAGNRDANTFTVRDTLVIYGDVTFLNKAMDFVIPTGGLVIIFGNLTFDNKLDIGNGGILVVTGVVDFDGGSGQTDYVDNGGEFFPMGGLTGTHVDANATAAAAASGPLANSGLTNIIDFVNGTTSSLPVELNSFQTMENGEQVNLEWSTASQLNFSHFQVEHSINAKDWSTLTAIEGEGTTNDLKEYFYTHSSPHNGKNYYRLRMVDLDETFEYSDIISANVSANSTVFLSPNPSRGGTVRYEMNFTPEEGDQLVVYDLVGGLVAAQNALSFTGELVLPGSLTRGTYLVRYKGKAVNQVVRLVVE